MNTLTSFKSWFEPKRLWLDDQWKRTASDDTSEPWKISFLFTASIPLPPLTALIIYFMQTTQAGNAFDKEMLPFFYFFACIAYPIYFSVLSYIGFNLKEKKHEPYFMFLSIQSFMLTLFCYASYLGLLVSPGGLSLIIALGIATMFFDSKQVFYAFISAIALVLINAFLQAEGYITLWPAMKSLGLAQQYNRETTLLIYAGLLPTFYLLYFTIVYLFVKNMRDINTELESLSLKLSKYLSPQIFNAIFSGEKDLHSGTYRKNLTVFFAGLNGFNDILDDLGTQKSTEILNQYLEEMSAIAISYGGTIDKFIGDNIMVFFGDPYSSGIKTDTENCVNMALAMRERFMHLRTQWFPSPFEEAVSINMGINTGYCTIGDFGSSERMDYTIIGGQVNLASRLKAKARNNSILISHESYSLVDDVVKCKPLGKIQVKGIYRDIQTYEVEGLYGEITEMDITIGNQLREFKQEIGFDKLKSEEKNRVLSFFKEK